MYSVSQTGSSFMSHVSRLPGKPCISPQCTDDDMAQMQMETALDYTKHTVRHSALFFFQ